ncbi:alkaline ceramidase 3-like [Mercenaria mercenaria]|uniref:alkaline ceramidase 3-like n=1 Tax=Mercenaria mercenaria TaxID=6596 RepID=UPI00234E7357|nr:alkaline ceramidase 3-like [Mercenaria mercenaria]
MIWGSAFLVYNVLMVEQPPNKSNVPLQIVLFLYCGVVTVVYMLCNYPVFFQTAYAIMVLSLVVSCVRLIRNLKKCNKKLFLTGVASYAFGFFLWNVDNGFCGSLQSLRNVLGPLSPFLELHAWWHLLAGLGTYLGLVFIADLRCSVLGQKARVKVSEKIVKPIKMSHNICEAE